MNSRTCFLALAGAGLAGAIGCNAVLGLGDYKVQDLVDASAPDGDTADRNVATDAPAADQATPAGDGGCDGSMGSVPCYSCAPQTNTDFLNACTGASCVPFDDSTRLKSWDGGELPPVPELDGGAG